MSETDVCRYCGHVGLSFSRDLGNEGYYCGKCGKFDKPKIELQANSQKGARE
jgi:transcription initiation factor TFIIIB Brf1 subunit/transcription initiation factor TFIIB